MITLFRIEEGIVRAMAPGEPLHMAVLQQAHWIDVLEPDAAEKALLQDLLHTTLPESGEIEEIEPSSRGYVDEAGLHLHSLFLENGKERKVTHSVVCILQPERLITMRDCELVDFRSLFARIRLGHLESHSATELLLDVFEMKVDTLADNLEEIHRRLEATTQQVLEDRSPMLGAVIDQLAKNENSNGKIQLALMDTRRDVTFLLKHLREQQALQEYCNDIMHDLDTLMAHNVFLSDKINFLMESTQGFISIQQNQVIKILSLAAVVFLPPTLVASIYGMNFIHMPELQWRYGYPLALMLMLATAALPFWFFKRKRWL